MNRQRVWIWMCLIWWCILPAGCAVGPDFTRPKPPAVDRYTEGEQPTATVEAEGQAQHFARGATVAGDWWCLFHSPQLDQAVREAVSNNPNLQAAQAALRQSQDLLQAGYGVFYPAVETDFNATRQKFSPARFGTASASSLFSLLTLSATVNYALDVFGGERRTVEGLAAQADYQKYAGQGAYLSLTGNVVTTLIALAGYREEIKATEEIAATIRDQIRLTETRVEAGTAPYANVLSLRSQLAAIEATIPALEQRASQAAHLLATLTGRTPAEKEPPALLLADLSLPADLPVTLPSDLVRQRPDILAAEAQVHRASAGIGVATAALFPSFTLTGNYGWNSNSTGDLIANNSNFWSTGANLTAPLFQGGTLWFQRKAAIAGYQGSLALYRQIVFAAFAQVADTLRALEHDAEALNSQSRALGAAEENVRLIQTNYQAGVADYLQLLIANGQYQQAKIGWIEARTQRLQDSAALLVALGGGWWNAEEGIDILTNSH